MCSARLLEDVFVYLCTHLAELITIGQLVSHFAAQNRKTSYDTVANYICYLEAHLQKRYIRHATVPDKPGSQSRIFGNRQKKDTDGA